MLRFKNFSLIKERHSFESDPKLMEYFDYLNKLLFKGDVKPVPLRYIKTKTKAGVMAIENGEIDYVGISSFFKFSKEKTLSILAHEMIHVLMFQKEIWDSNDHGFVFQRFVDNFNKKQNEFVITKTEKISDVEVSSNKKKEIGVILFTLNKKDYAAVYINSKLINDQVQLNSFCNTLKRYITWPQSVFNKDSSIKLDFYKVDNPIFSKFKIKRILNLKNLELLNVTENELEEIRNGEHIFDCTIK